MKNPISIEVEIHGKTMKYATGLLARQANGAVSCQLGETFVFSAVTATDKPREGIDYFPLQVEYREKFYAAGRFPGGYFKREGRPTEKEILTARLTDRPIRPLFPDGYYNEVQVNNTLQCADGEHESDVLSINAASAALMISDIPFYGPIGAVRVGRINGQLVINPTHTEIVNSDLDLIYVGNRQMPIMIEGSANEISETDMVAAMKFGHEAIQKILDAQLQLRQALGLPEKQVVDTPLDSILLDKARELASAELSAALLTVGKQEREEKVKAIRGALEPKMNAAFPERMQPELFRQIFDHLEIEMVRKNVIENHHRIDGRGLDDLRSLEAQIGLFPRTHGSALFSRGETQALAVVTLGTTADAQEMDGLTGGPDEKTFILHYNFPPFSTGEVGRLGATGRREIGHGALAERSIFPMMPKDYPYTIRVVSEIMSSNGSSSMASICAGTLALMDAGVPLKKPVAGISIGLFTGASQAILVTDILGAEDHCGDMDFKVAGTRDGITGFQVDLKLRGLKWELVEGAFARARAARLKILDYMSGILAQPRPQLSPYAPRVEIIKINPEKIGALIGPGGKNIRKITDTTGVQIDIDDDGTVHLFSNDRQAMEAALNEVHLITAQAEVGKVYHGKITGIKDFGCFVEILPGQEGLVHISELADFRVRQVEDVVKVGELIWVKCLSVEENGKIRLSRKAALEDKDIQERSLE